MLKKQRGKAAYKREYCYPPRHNKASYDKTLYYLSNP